jgi:predicted lactoylglutathione lyase
MIFVNLPVTDLSRAVAFYEAVGAVNDPRFTDDTAACMSWSDSIHVMLLTHEKYRQFTPKHIIDAREASEVILCLSRESRADVDATLARARAAGARPDPTPEQEFGFMYGRSFEDPDGHAWEVMWMDVDAAMKAGLGQPVA